MTTNPTVQQSSAQDKAQPIDTRIAVIDIGSNSVRFVIYEIRGCAAAPVFNEKILAGLGRSLSTDGRLYGPGVAQTFKALHRFKAMAEAHKLDDVYVVATAAMREASDGPKFIKRVKSEIGFEVEVLSGKDEAQMAAYGVISGDRRARGIVADLGGASLELIRVADGKAQTGETFPLGPFVMMDGIYDEGTLREKIRAGIAGTQTQFSAQGDSLYLVGGSWRNLALIHNERKGYPMRILQNYSMRTEEAMSLAQWASGEAARDLMKWPGLSSRRAETLPYAGLMLEALIDNLNPASIVISPGGVREGKLYISLPENIRARDGLFDACEHLASGNEQGMDFGLPLYDWLKSAAQHFPACFDTVSEDRLRRAACVLVGMGKGLHPDHRADLVFEDVLYAPLSGLTHKERAYLALMLYSSYTSSSRTPNDAAIDYHLLDREKKCARVFGRAMRMGNVISGLSAAMLSRFTLSATPETLSLTVDEADQALFNRRGQLRLKRLADLAGLKPESNWVQAS